MLPLYLISLATLGCAFVAARMSLRQDRRTSYLSAQICHESQNIRKEVKLMAEITSELFDGLLGKLEELADADPEDKETIQRLQSEVGELTLRAASQDAKYGWINDNERQARVSRLAEKVGLATPLPPTGPEAPLPSGPAPEAPVVEEPVADNEGDLDNGEVPADVAEPIVDESTDEPVVSDEDMQVDGEPVNDEER